IPVSSPIGGCFFLRVWLPLSYQKRIKMNDMNKDTNRSEGEDLFRREARRNHEYFRRHARRNRGFGGLFLLLVGIVLLMRESGVYFPDWFFTWPMILIVLGVFSG